jgi:hypothetical protein
MAASGFEIVNYSLIKVVITVCFQYNIKVFNSYLKDKQRGQVISVFWFAGMLIFNQGVCFNVTLHDHE